MRAHRLLVGLAALLLAACARDGQPGPVAFVEAGMPKALSDWNVVYVANGKLRLNDRVVPYDLATPLFTDYAHKLRTVWMPEGVTARYDAEGAFKFPVGTILSKTFYYPRGKDGSVLRSVDAGSDLRGGGLDLSKVRLVETRLLVRRLEGWVALPYVWNAGQDEARLMRSGELLPMTLVDGGGTRTQIDYAVPDQNQCAGCHATDLTQQAVFPIGPKARHLNRDIAYASGKDNQIAHWARIGYLSGVPQGTLPADPLWGDAAAPLEARARAYLDINCGHCHSPAGAAKTSGMWLDAATQEPLRLGRCKLPIAAGKGTGDRQHGIVPGQPDASILTYRMVSTDPSVMMPELGRSIAHDEGVQLIRDWIAEMQGNCDTHAGATPAATQ